jgi:3-hydroxyacyl-CoA dehydrogenase/enoyl-CoA hydratase/3-hydroxybutyryl-CoA epimerase
LLNHPAHADIGAISAGVFPAWTGGTLTFIDSVGIEHFVAEYDRMTKSYGSRFAVSGWLRQRAKRGERFHADL